jgi:flagellar biosynthesis protein FliR
MIHISVLELVLTCGLILLLLVVPIMFKRFYARMDKRLQDIENKLEKKK